MPIYRSKDGKKLTRLYVDEVKRLHATKDLLADLALNQPLIDAYISAYERLAKVCDLWPIPESKEKKDKPADPTTDAGMSGPFPKDGELDASPAPPQSMEAASDPQTA